MSAKSNKRSKSSSRWLKEHFDDPYVKEAQRLGYRSRAAFKLLEIQEKDKLLKPGQIVVDLGAAPGGWSQIATKLVGPQGKVFALDILPMEPLDGVFFIEGDFREEHVLSQLTSALENHSIDLVISDIAPNMSGSGMIDQPRAMYLTELALDFTKNHLRIGGNYVVKVFQGDGFDNYLRELRQLFEKVLIRKPKASRDRSREVYLVGLSLRKSL